MARAKTAQSSAGHRAFSGQAADDSGFSLVEVLVALTLFMIVSGAAIWWLVETINLTGSTRNQVAAANLATQELEKIRAERNAGRQLDSANYAVTLRNVTYSVQPVLNPSATTACSSGQSRQVTVVVTWSGTSSIRLSSVLAC